MLARKEGGAGASKSTDVEAGGRPGDGRGGGLRQVERANGDAAALAGPALRPEDARAIGLDVGELDGLLDECSARDRRLRGKERERELGKVSGRRARTRRRKRARRVRHDDLRRSGKTAEISKGQAKDKKGRERGECNAEGERRPVFNAEGRVGGSTCPNPATSSAVHGRAATSYLPAAVRSDGRG